MGVKQGNEDFHAHARLSIVDGSDNESDTYALCEVNGKTLPSENQSLLLAIISRGLDRTWRFEAVDQCVRTSLLDKGVQQFRLQLSDKQQHIQHIHAQAPQAYKKSVQHIHAQAPAPSLLHFDWLPPGHSITSGGLEIFTEDQDDTDSAPDMDPFAQALGTPKTGCKSTELDAHVAHRLGERRWKTSL